MTDPLLTATDWSRAQVREHCLLAALYWYADRADMMTQHLHSIADRVQPSRYASSRGVEATA